MEIREAADVHYNHPFTVLQMKTPHENVHRTAKPFQYCKVLYNTFHSKIRWLNVQIKASGSLASREVQPERY